MSWGTELWVSCHMCVIIRACLKLAFQIISPGNIIAYPRFQIYTVRAINVASIAVDLRTLSIPCGRL